MSTTTENNNMSLHENMDRPPVEKPKAGDNKQTYRLYPSLPNIDRYEVCAMERSVWEKPQTAADRHPDSLQGDTQTEVSAAGGDVTMRAQILILEEQRRELLSINEKWAKEYRTMRQYYKDKVRDLNALLQHDHSHSEEMCEEGEINVTLHEKFKTVKEKKSTWTGDGDASSELLTAEKEAKELRAQNNTLIRKGQHQREEIRRLNKALEEALQSSEVSSETLQDVWKHQAEVYKEDFLKERRDREKLKEKYLELEKKFRKVYNELRVLKPQGTRPPQSALECTCTNRAKGPNWEIRVRH